MSFLNFEKMSTLTESFKRFSLDIYGFYIVILLLRIRSALIKYHVKPLGLTKAQGFRQDLYRYDLFLYP